MAFAKSTFVVVVVVAACGTVAFKSQAHHGRSTVLGPLCACQIHIFEDVGFDSDDLEELNLNKLLIFVHKKELIVDTGSTVFHLNKMSRRNDFG